MKVSKAVIYAACRLVEAGNTASCPALGGGGDGFGSYINMKAVNAYRDFYKQNHGQWPGLFYAVGFNSTEAKTQRILLLLLFLEAQGQI